jgi:hypothetical protein
VPLTAQHAAAGVLDATVDPLGEGTPWEAIHRARPRAPLTCRECGHGLPAKLSPKGLRFFAHDRAAPTCSLTTRPHVLAERAQLAATERRRELDDIGAAERERHRAAIAALLARQQALIRPAVQLVGREARGHVGVRDAVPAWAMGVPLFVHDMPQGVISPVVSRISAEVLERFRGLTLFAATEAERKALVRACGPGQRIVLFEVEVPDQPQPPATNYRRAGRVR